MCDFRYIPRYFPPSNTATELCAGCRRIGLTGTTSDLISIMRVVFINNSGDHFTDVRAQVKSMNTRVIDTATAQVKTGVAQYIAYRDAVSQPLQLMDRSVNTSTAGKKIPQSGDFV